MTWLSRLLPQRNRLELVGTPKNRTPVSKRNRRQMTLEALEHRVVLSVTAVPNFSGVLNITVDKFANNFSIEEFKINSTQSKVTLTANDAKTLINGGSSWTSFGAVSSINVKIVAGAQPNKDIIELFGEGIGTQQGVKNVSFAAASGSAKGLVLDVHDINNSGAFSVTTHGLLDLDMDSAKWNSISITQDGCCPADVSITNSIAGAVTVKEGWGDGSSINLDNDQFGVTKLYQAYGKKDMRFKNCDANDDSITVTNSRLNSLYIDQNASSDGNNNTVLVDTVSIALLPKPQKTGITVVQGNGDTDEAVVTNVSTFGNPNLASCVGISITQGSGHNDYAEVSHATVPGDVTIVQQDLLGGPDDHGLFGDTALIDDVHAGRPKEKYCGKISITQGDAKGDSATIQDSSTEELDVCIVQGDGELDDALVSNVTSGGGIYVTQGDSIPTGDPDKDPHGGDTATVDGSTAEDDIKITQGDGSDTATVSNSTAGYDPDPTDDYDKYGDIVICQGDGDDDTATVDTSTANNGDIKITQGDGDRDHATIQNSTAGKDICVTQGDGDLDVVDILGVIAGSVDYDHGYPKDIHGDVTVVQGDGQHDIVNVDEYGGVFTQINNLYIIQGDSLPSDDCDIDAYYSDEVHINDSIITSDIYVSQGFSWVVDDSVDGGGSWVETGFGYYLITIGDTSPVTAGGSTYLEQAGEGNTVILGGASGEGSGLFDFITAWLDVWTGSGGGAFVSATNTQVLYGSFWGNDWTIDGGGEGNVFYDGGGNDGVTYSDNFNVTPEF